MEREYDQQVQQHDGQYRDGRNDGSRYSSDRMANYNNKKKLLNQRSSKEKDRRGSDCKVTTSLQFKNQTRNKTNDCGLPMVGPGGVAGGQVVHRNSAGALSGSVQSNKMNNAIVLPVGGVPERILRRIFPNSRPRSSRLNRSRSRSNSSSSINSNRPTTITTICTGIRRCHVPVQSAGKRHHPVGRDWKTDIPKYPPPQAQRLSKDRQQPLPAGLPATHPARSLRRRSNNSCTSIYLLFSAVVITFFVCWAPFHAQRLLYLYGRDWQHFNTVNTWLFSVAGWLYYVS
ncbi:hypothetical protein pipiens_002842, partial [Culex pipiens pipiens]